MTFDEVMRFAFQSDDAKRYALATLSAATGLEPVAWLGQCGDDDYLISFDRDELERCGCYRFHVLYMCELAEEKTKKT